MSIHIIGMEMPKEGFVEILIRDDGTVQQTGRSYRIEGTDYYAPYVGEMPAMYKAVSVLPHGRLIDADALSSKLTDLAENEWNQRTGTTWAEAFEEVDGFIQDAPTIIPVDLEKEGET